VNIIHFPDIPEEAKYGILTIGTFDGVHLGHQQVIDKMYELSLSANNQNKVVLTFSNHPRAIIHSEQTVELLTLCNEKIRLLEQKMIEYVCLLPFTKDFATQTAEDFILNYISKLSPSFLVIGREHFFGNNQSGNIETFQKFQNTFGYKVIEVNEYRLDNMELSSTAIRNLLKAGKVKEAATLLGYQYTFSGTVEHGLKIGQTIGYPTANISVNKQKLIPASGVYAVKVYVQNNIFDGMLYIGNRPTLSKNDLSIEIHLFNFSGDLYNKELKVKLIERIRDDMKFNNTSELVAQIDNDSKQIKQILEL